MRHPGSAATAPRVLVVLGTEGAWSRGVLRGFMAVAHEENWTLLHYWPGSDLKWVAEEWSPAVVVFGSELDAETTGAPRAGRVRIGAGRSQRRRHCFGVSGRGGRGGAGRRALARESDPITSARSATTTLPSRWLANAPSVARALEAGAEVAAGWGNEDYSQSERRERPRAMAAWLRSLPKPCGIFTGTDGWANTVARYAREVGLRIPEDIALVGADNDVLGCELLRRRSRASSSRGMKSVVKPPCSCAWRSRTAR